VKSHNAHLYVWLTGPVHLRLGLSVKKDMVKDEAFGNEQLRKSVGARPDLNI